MKHFNKQLCLVVSLLALFLILLGHFSKISPKYPYGDSFEYILTTQSWVNHGTPNIKYQDLDSYISYLDGKSLKRNKVNYFNSFLNYLKFYEENGSQEVNDWTLQQAGIFVAENDKLYSFHFPFYSLLNAPAQWVFHSLNADIRIAFIATNLLFLILAIYLTFRENRLPLAEQIILSLLFLFSPVFWYMDWPHPEVFAGTTVYLACLYFYTKRLYFSIFLFSIASMQFQPLFIPALILCLYLIFRDGFKLKTLLKLFVSSFWVLLPSLYYLYFFGKPNLIIDLGFLDSNLVELKRLSSFFFDLNQGLIIGIPFILLIYLFFFISDLIKRKPRPYHFALLIVLFMSYFFLQMINWNHDNAVVNRYVVWTSIFFVVAYFMRIKRLSSVLFFVFAFLGIGTQAWAIFSQKNFQAISYDSMHHNALAKYVMRNYPSFYNPDPRIFRLRNNPFMISTTDSVKVFTNKEDTIVKILIHKNSLNQLIQRGIKKESLEEYKNQLTFYQDFTYINKADLDALGYVQSQDTLIDRIEKDKYDKMIKDAAQSFRNDPFWSGIIRKQAEEANISFDSALILNAKYSYNSGYAKRND